MLKNQTIKSLTVCFAAAVGLTACVKTSEFDAMNDTYDKTVSHIMIDKSDRLMTLFNREGRFVKSYEVGLGFNPVGDKIQQGDGRTPEGTYIINRKNPQSSFTLSLGVSYPDVNDRKEARARGVSPGGDIFIHGQPTGTRDNWQSERGQDWTAGCIAVSNAEIREIYSMVRAGTTITIRP